MVVLNALIHDKWQHAESWPEMSALISEVMLNLKAEGAVSHGTATFQDTGEDARFMFSHRRHHGDGDWPNNHLVVAVNRATGYGGLIWYVTKDFPEKGGIYDHVWISDNPDPPMFDPRVVSDPCEPTFHDPRSALPLADVSAVLEEFCRVGTGDRPQSINWVRGWMNGHRLDRSRRAQSSVTAGEGHQLQQHRVCLMWGP